MREWCGVVGADGGFVAVLLRQYWKSIGGGVLVRCGGDLVLPMLVGNDLLGWYGSRRKPSLMFCWADRGYAFERCNPLGGTVEVPTSSLP
uniref:Uncharacterized protein n=1 Tax=Leersia perrieri TaxID=77586 RepID=A0A0D9VG77_9ORYZ